MLEIRKSRTGLSGSDGVDVRASMASDKDHLQSMKEKLIQIQSNKQALESKIKEYETQLLRISYEPGTQEILAKFKPGPRSGSVSAISGDNVSDQHMQSCSEYTLGESARTT